ncbi:MAG: hypothetical protein KDA20_01090 [Phycisphaerales bacterium]|nr:hypothetical protein [Phycisphaerales bacterium]
MRRATCWSVALVLAAAGSVMAAPEDGVQGVQPGVQAYRGYKLIEVEIQSKAQYDAMHDIGECLACRAGPGAQLFIVAPEKLDALTRSGIDYLVREEDVQKHVDAQAEAMQARRAAEAVRARAGVDTFFDDYRTYAEINARLDELIALNPTICSGFVAGTTIEGRQIRGIKVANLDPGDPAADEASKPGFALQGGQHAREWAAPSSVMYFADTIVRDYGVDPVVTDMVDNVVFYIIPSMNPDGYIYTFPVAQGGSNVRLWRKNRRNNGGSFGVDLNRNWSVDWGDLAGASNSPTSETYHGTGPFSEPETSTVSSFMSSLPNLKAHLDIHTYSQLILGPWAYSETVCPPREAELRAVQTAMEAAMDGTHGVNYTAGLGCDALLYVATGTAPDWYFDSFGALSWTYELRDTGFWGFELPPDQIIPTAEEVFQGIRTLAEYIQIQLDIATSGIPATVQSNATYDFGVAITGFNGETYQSGSGMLHWRAGNSGPFTAVALAGADPQALIATLPAQPCDTELQYYLSAQTVSGTTVFDPAGGAASPYSTMVVELSYAANDTMEAPTGWSVIAGATTGNWELADPQGTAAQPEDDHTVAGTMCWVTEAAAGTSVGSFDIDGGTTTLTSPIYDLSGSADAQVSYWRWYSNDAGASPNEDTFRVDISNDGGSNWVNVETVGPSGPEVSGGWFQHAFNVSSFVSTSAQVRLRFIAEDIGLGSVVEAAVDDFQIVVFEQCQTTTCPGDTDGNNTVDLADLNNVLFNFGGPGPLGDVDNSGGVDLTDLNLVLFNFGTSC